MRTSSSKWGLKSLFHHGLSDTHKHDYALFSGDWLLAHISSSQAGFFCQGLFHFLYQTLPEIPATD